ncbi:hypothetical protein BDV59DRAFT_186839 [Aspergillus ambiguus]|uniref:uncharacterized protein n=1 Tax=Aspergillus ambiguus TaxID=176160 RepID=UPI003CCCF05F
MDIRLIGNQSDCIRNKFRIRSSIVYLIEPRFTTECISCRIGVYSCVPTLGNWI